MACLLHSFENSLHSFRKATVHCCLGNVQLSCLGISISCCLGISQLCCLGISQTCCLGISQSCCLGIFQPCCLGNDQLCSQSVGCSAWLPNERYFQLGCPEGGCFGKTAQKEDDSAWLPRRGEISFAAQFRMFSMTALEEDFRAWLPEENFSFAIQTFMMWRSSEEEEHKLLFVAPVLQL